MKRLAFAIFCTFPLSVAAQQPIEQPQSAAPRVAANTSPTAPVANAAGGTPAAQGFQNAIQPLQAAPAAPIPPLSPQLQAYLDQLLNHWSQQTKKIERYRCDFQRWSYDDTKTQGNNIHFLYSQGVIRYMAPDKGLFRVDQQFFFQGMKPDGTPDFKAIANQFGEYWICDGIRIHSYDRTMKKVDRYELPANMRGMEITNAPLPFLFGIDPKQAKERYWMQPVQAPPGPNGQPLQDRYVIEAYPKLQADAANYQMVKVTLDNQEFLPLSLEIMLPGHIVNAQTKAIVKDSREVYEFNNREVNWNLLNRMAEVLKFKEEFIPQDPPKDWQIEDHKLDAPPVAQ